MAEMRTVLTPSEINLQVRQHLEAGFPRVWIEGEISNLSRPASGHLYFSLKDEKAQLDCAMFLPNARKLGFRPGNGQLVQVRGRLGLYEPRGRFQLIADHMEEAGEGRLRAAFEALKRKLEAEGLFDPAARQPLPAFPRRIGVLTSPSGAAVRDIIHVLARRWPVAGVRLYAVPVQGAEAPPAIRAALAAANRHGWADALILGRGGGSLEDLWAFNDEEVARAVFASRIPVISAVGHEIDFSITDFVADLRAPTPSAAAELLTPDAAELRRRFVLQRQRLERSATARLNQLSQRQDQLAARLGRQHPMLRIRQAGRELARARLRLAVLASRLVPGRERELLSWRERLESAARRLVPQRQQRLAVLARTLHALSPLPTLERGFAIVSDASTGGSIDSVDRVRPGQRIDARLRDGIVEATVSGVRRPEEGD